MDQKIVIAEWDSKHPQWSSLSQFFKTHQKDFPETFQGYEQRDSRVLVAYIGVKHCGRLTLYHHSYWP